MVIKQVAEDPKGKEFNLRIKHLEFIGKGSFGLVYKGQIWTAEKPDHKIEAAIKFSKDADGFKELELLRKCDHECVVKLYFFFVWEEDDGDKRVNLVLELFDNDLYAVLKKDWTKSTGLGIYTEVYMYQCFLGLAYLESKSIGHRDIKPENLLCRKDNGLLKISDFGCGKVFAKNQLNGHYVGTRYYRAPELLLGGQQYTESCDWWSAMCVLAELILSVPLFHGHKNDDNQLECVFDVLGIPSDKDIGAMKVKHSPKLKYAHGSKMTLEDVFQGEYFPSTGNKKNFLDVCSKVICYDPTKRMPPMKVCKHPYFERLKNPSQKLPNGNPLPAVVRK